MTSKAGTIFFCGVDSRLDRLAGSRDDEPRFRAILAAPASVCVLFRGKQIGTNVSDGSLAFRPLRDAIPETLTFLGLDKLSPAPHRGIFVGQAVPGFSDASVGFSDVVPAVAKLSREESAIAGLAKSASKLGTIASHCPTCGAATESRAGGTKRVCAACKPPFEIFTRTDPVAIAIPVHPTDPRRCLLVRKPIYTPKTRYTAVAGFLEPGENAEEAACREVQEETGVMCRPSSARYIASQPWPGEPHGQLMIGFLLQAETEEIRIDESELEDARWWNSKDVADGLAKKPESPITVPGPWALALVLMEAWLRQLP